MQSIAVHVEQPSPRAWYTVHHVLERLLGWTLEWHDDLGSFRASGSPKLFYGAADEPGAFNIRPAGLLSEWSPRQGDPDTLRLPGLTALFPVSGGHMPFDVFAASFWMLSRMEEYALERTDAHGRVLTADLLAARRGFLDVPVVDEWALLLARTWHEQDDRVPMPVRKYSHVFTMDVDNGFAYLGRPWWRMMGAHLRAVIGNRKDEMVARRQVLSGRTMDPFDIYADLEHWTDGLADRRILFWLTAPRGKHDHAVPFSFPLLAQRVKDCTVWAEIGIHPSYDSSARPELIAHQRTELASASGAAVDVSRQHFLRVGKYELYAELLRLGVLEDHSMGLHDELGYRAGTCTPFKWYDLRNEAATELDIWPHTVMDNTLHRKLKLSPAEGAIAAKRMVDKVRAVQGTFIGLWHESYLSDHLEAKGWRDAILDITRYAKP